MIGNRETEFVVIRPGRKGTQGRLLIKMQLAYAPTRPEERVHLRHTHVLIKLIFT